MEQAEASVVPAAAAESTPWTKAGAALTDLQYGKQSSLLLGVVLA